MRFSARRSPASMKKGSTQRQGRFSGAQSLIRRAREAMLDCVWPEGFLCASCGQLSRGGVLCPGCRNALCTGDMMHHWEFTPLPGLPAYSLRSHEREARQLVIRLKHQAEKRIAAELAELVLPLPAGLFFSKDTVVTWVPMPPGRLRERCIDHSRLLAEAMAAKLELSCRPLLTRRETGDKTQATLNRAQRQKNLKRAFVPMENLPREVLLIDDVLTTGTTLLRCAEALRSGGTERITALTVTRSMHGPGRR